MLPPLESLSPEEQQITRERSVAMRVHVVLLVAVVVLSVIGTIYLSMILKPLALPDRMMAVIVDMGLLVPGWCYLLFSEIELRDGIGRGKLARYVGLLSLISSALAGYAFRSVLMTLAGACVAAVFGLLVAAACYGVVRLLHGSPAPP